MKTSFDDWPAGGQTAAAIFDQIRMALSFGK